ncbi:MAG: zinc ribbon domain-containing protein [Gemmatimonadales bacterium]|nr:zinc ribbon domain-containing protein [Gemmatimonadales bacterium]
MTCHACGATLAPTAKFCHKCGAATGASPSAHAAGWRAGLPWAIAGAAFGALVTILVVRTTGARSTEQAAPSSQRPAPAPDISQMSAAERANRLFDRVMILAEAGKTDSVQFFLPMALGAYGMLPTLDADARYHIGLLELAGGDPAAALAQADTIRRAVATHLFIPVLRAHAYQQQGNRQLERRAYADFLRQEEAELARNRPEYNDHRTALTAFRAEAARQAAATP